MLIFVVHVVVIVNFFFIVVFLMAIVSGVAVIFSAFNDFSFSLFVYKLHDVIFLCHKIIQLV